MLSEIAMYMLVKYKIDGQPWHWKTCEDRSGSLEDK